MTLVLTLLYFLHISVLIVHVPVLLAGYMYELAWSICPETIASLSDL